MTKDILAVPSEAKQLEALRNLLETRLQLHKEVYRLDLRIEPLKSVVGKNTLQLRKRQDAQWPKRGPTTNDRDTALKWAREDYAPWILNKMVGSPESPPNLIKVREAARNYINALEAEATDSMEARSIRSRVCAVERHIIETIGDEVLAQLTWKRVRDVLSSLQQVDSQTGARTKEPLSLASKKNVASALSAIWEMTFGDVPMPFHGVRRKLKEDKAKRRKEIRQGDAHEQLRRTRKGYLSAELVPLLVAAVFYDRCCSARPNLRSSFIANTAFSIALALCTGLRVSEEVFLRWKHFDWAEGVLAIPGTKSTAALRSVPLQATLRPWYDAHLAFETARLGRPPHPDELVLVTNPHKWNPANVIGTLEDRWLHVALIAGVKLPGKNLHAPRATYATLMTKSGRVPLEWVRFYLGHHNAFGDQTSTYVDAQHVTIDKQHGTVMSLPDPTAISTALGMTGEAEGFRPVWIPMPRKKKQP